MSRVDWRRARQISTGREEMTRVWVLEGVGGGDGDGEVGVGGSLGLVGGCSLGEKELRRLRREVRMDVMMVGGCGYCDGDSKVDSDGSAVGSEWEAVASGSVMVGR